MSSPATTADARALLAAARPGGVIVHLVESYLALVEAAEACACPPTAEHMACDGCDLRAMLPAKGGDDA